MRSCGRLNSTIYLSLQIIQGILAQLLSYRLLRTNFKSSSGPGRQTCKGSPLSMIPSFLQPRRTTPARSSRIQKYLEGQPDNKCKTPFNCTLFFWIKAISQHREVIIRQHAFEVFYQSEEGVRNNSKFQRMILGIFPYSTCSCKSYFWKSSLGLRSYHSPQDSNQICHSVVRTLAVSK